MTPGAGVRRIRTGPQFRKKCTQTAVDWPRLVPMLTLLLPADIVAASSREDKQQWLSALGGNARGRRRFAQVHSPAQIPLKSPSVLSRRCLPGAGQGQRREEAGDGGNWRRGPRPRAVIPSHSPEPQASVGRDCLRWAFAQAVHRAAEHDPGDLPGLRQGQRRRAERRGVRIVPQDHRHLGKAQCTLRLPSGSSGVAFSTSARCTCTCIGDSGLTLVVVFSMRMRRGRSSGRWSARRSTPPPRRASPTPASHRSTSRCAKPAQHSVASRVAKGL